MNGSHTMKQQNIIQIFEDSVQKHLNALCLQHKVHGDWEKISWDELRIQTQKMIAVLKGFGLNSEDRVCILAKTRYEWTVADLAILASGCVTVPIYESNTPEQVEFVITDSDAKLIFVENQTQLQKVQAVWPKLKNLKAVIVFESHDKLLEKNKVLSWRECMLTADVAEGQKIYLKNLSSIPATQMASIVYTSGTTGNPKGAVLTHDNFLAAIEAGSAVFHFRQDMTGLIFLPLAHILGRITQFYQIANGFSHAYAESIEKLIDNIAEIKPHYLVSVPRIFEKVYERSLYSMESLSPIQKKIFKWALSVGERFSQKELNHEKISFFLQAKNKVADRLVFQKIKSRLGGRIEFCISGGAPLSPEVGRFFFAIGMKILEGYGLTETTAANVVNRQNHIKIGTVGQAFPGIQLRIAEDGEILIRGRVVFKEYHKNSEATKDAISSDGWFHTGDVGELDAEGFLKITDRKKEIIVTAGGKKIAPQNIENLLKNDPFISQAIIHGDRRKFVSALVTLNPDIVKTYAKQHNLSFSTYEDLIQNPQIYALIKEKIEQKNTQLAQFESIKKFAILPQDFSIESGELTPSLKLKRKVIQDKYASLFDGFYQD